MSQHKPECKLCGDQYPTARWVLGYTSCLKCGEKIAKKVMHTIAPLHKSNYILITNRADLTGINTKGGLVK